MNEKQHTTLGNDISARRASRSRRMRWISMILVLILIFAGSGAIYQTVGERHDLREHPAPGKMIDVGGHRLHLYCTGNGAPTVILEAGLGNDINHWSLVQPEIAKDTRVCAYDRAGLGWSEAGPFPRTATQVVQELELLLGAAGESPPFVLVGHSNGGLYVHLYTVGHPEKVGGLVLVDPNPEEFRVCEQLPASTQALYGTLVALAPVGVPRLLLPWLFPLKGSSLPPEGRVVHGVLRARTSALRAVWSEWKSTCASLEALREADPLRNNLPLVVISAGNRPPNQDKARIARLHRELAQKSTAGKFVLAAESGHWVQLDNPDLVVKAVRDVIAQVRK